MRRGRVGRLSGGDFYCAAFGGAAAGVVENAGVERFKVTYPTGEGCPQPGSPSGAFLDAVR